jgi:small-conductance mechanosensitive channel
MDRHPDISAWRDVLLQVASELGTRLSSFIPNLLGALLIFVVGWLLSRSVEIAASRTLRTVGLDRAAARLRLTDVLERAGLRLALSELLARLLFWLLMLTFLLSSVETLGLTAVTATIDRLIAYIPNLVGAALITLLGLLFSRFVASLVSSAAAAAGFPSAARLGFVVQVLVAGLAIVAAIEQLGVSTAVLVGPLTAVLATAGFTAGLAFALGARPVVTHILAGHFLRQSLPRDSFVEVDGERGIVERVGSTDTVLRNGEKSWSIPNAQLLDRVIVR